MKVLVLEGNVPRLEKELTRLAKRAVKLGCEAPTWEVGGQAVRRQEIGTIEGVKQYEFLFYRQVEVEGTAPKYAGWTLVAVLQALGVEGNLLKMVPGVEVAGTEVYRKAKPACEQCKVERRRTETFLVRNEEGVVKQVGRQCLKDFLGHDNPEKLAQYAELLAAVRAVAEDAEDGAWGGGGGGGARAFDVTTYLAMVVAVIRERGWMSRAAAREIGTGVPATADQAIGQFDPKLKPEDKVPLAEVDFQKATAVVEWAEGLADDVNDFLWNVRTVVRFGYVDWKSAGIAAAAVTAYDRAMGIEAEKKAQAAKLANSEFIGAEGGREIFTFTLVKLMERSSDWGVTRIHRFLDDKGNAVMWFATKDSGMEVGGTYQVKATVKRHEVYKGIKQTTVTRLTVIQKVEENDGAQA